MTDEAQAGQSRAKLYSELLEKYPSWTPAMIADMPLTQLVAIFTPAEDVFHSFAEAKAYLNERRAKREE